MISSVLSGILLENKGMKSNVQNKPLIPQL